MACDLVWLDVPGFETLGAIHTLNTRHAGIIRWHGHGLNIDMRNIISIVRTFSTTCKYVAAAHLAGMLGQKSWRNAKHFDRSCNKHTKQAKQSTTCWACVCDFDYALRIGRTKNRTQTPRFLCVFPVRFCVFFYGSVRNEVWC